jgi:hypothetical protein
MSQYKLVRELNPEILKAVIACQVMKPQVKYG